VALPKPTDDDSFNPPPKPKLPGRSITQAERRRKNINLTLASETVTRLDELAETLPDVALVIHMGGRRGAGVVIDYLVRFYDEAISAGFVDAETGLLKKS
jgi:hypothetical protein